MKIGIRVQRRELNRLIYHGIVIMKELPTRHLVALRDICNNTNIKLYYIDKKSSKDTDLVVMNSGTVNEVNVRNLPPEEMSRQLESILKS